jgi:hypothetical protein
MRLYPLVALFAVLSLKCSPLQAQNQPTSRAPITLSGALEHSFTHRLGLLQKYGTSEAAVRSLMEAASTLPPEDAPALSRTKRRPLQTLLNFWHFEDYGLLLNRIASQEEAERRVRIVPTTWASVDYNKAAELEGKTLQQYLDMFPKKAAELAAAVSFGNIEVNDYIDMDREDNLFFLRLRSDFQYYNEDVDGLTMNWERDYTSDQGDFFEFHGAAMLDAYFGKLYHLNFRNGGSGELPSRTFLRIGAEWDRSTNGSEEDEDVRKYFGLVTFWTERLLPFYNSNNPQILQLGAMYEDDALTDVQNLKFVFNWEPRLQLMRGFRDSGFGQLLSIGRRMHFARSKPLSLLNLDDIPGVQKGEPVPGGLSEAGLAAVKFIQANGEQKADGSDLKASLTAAGLEEVRREMIKLREQFPDYFFVRPKIGLEQILDQSGIVQGGIAEEDLTLALRLRTGFTMFRELATFSYNLVGQSSIQNYDGFAIMHELRLDVKFLPQDKAIAEERGRLRPFLKAYLAYQNGEEAPSFRKVDRIAAGLSLQF